MSKNFRRYLFIFLYFAFAAGYPFVYFHFWIVGIVQMNLMSPEVYFFMNLLIYPASFMLIASRDGAHVGPALILTVFVNVMIYLLVYLLLIQEPLLEHSNEDHG